jgi:AraC family transcriptional regulator
VQTNPERDISLESLAREYGYSPTHFHRLFTEAVGETPKDHVERVRLERAAYRLAITRDSVLSIALSVGFQSHETFSRAFKRRFGRTPTEWRQASHDSQKHEQEAGHFVRGDGCRFSDVSFLTLRPMTLLAMRRIGPYGTMGPPNFDGAPSDWSPLIDVASHETLAFRPLGVIFSYDNPYLTPPHLQHLDACVPLVKSIRIRSRGQIRRLDFSGGLYGVIEYRGPVDRLIQGYSALVDGIARSGRFRMRDGPPVEILREITPDGDPMTNLNEIYLPVEPHR